MVLGRRDDPVEPVRSQPLFEILRRFLAHDHAQVRKALVDMADDPGQKPRPYRGQNPRAKPPAERNFASDAGAQVFDGTQDAMGAPHDFAALARRVHTGSVALEQTDAEVALELGDLGSKAGLADVQRLGGQVETPQPGHRRDVFHLSQGWAHYIA